MDLFSQASEDLTSDSNVPGCESSGSARPTSGAGASSPSTGPECPATPTCAKYQPLKKLTEAQLAESITLYQAGSSLGKIAARMGVSRQAMHDLLKRRIVLRGRLEALPRKEPTAIRAKRAATNQRYRSRAARITRAQIRAVKARDVVCRICFGEGTDIDHCIPVARGGQTVMENLQLLCHPCHVEKTRAERKGVV